MHKGKKLSSWILSPPQPHISSPPPHLSPSHFRSLSVVGNYLPPLQPPFIPERVRKLSFCCYTHSLWMKFTFLCPLEHLANSNPFASVWRRIDTATAECLLCPKKKWFTLCEKMAKRTQTTQNQTKTNKKSRLKWGNRMNQVTNVTTGLPGRFSWLQMTLNGREVLIPHHSCSPQAASWEGQYYY